MRVAFINQPWNAADPPVESGSVAIWVYEVARRLARSCQVTVYANRCRAEKRAECSGGVYYRYISTSLDRPVLRLLHLVSDLYRPTYPYFARWLHYLGYAVKVSLDLRRTGCDIVHVQNLSQFVPIIRALNPAIGIVLHMHCEWLTQLEPGVIRRRLEKTDSVVGCSEYVTEKVRRRFPEIADRCWTIYNGVDVNTHGARTGRKDGAAPRILFVGRISPDKGLHVLLEALRRVIQEYPDVQLDIVGPQAAPPLAYVFKLTEDPKVSALVSFCGRDYMAYLKEQVTSQEMKGVSFSGAVPHSALAERYAAADVYVQPSFTETFGVPIAEAMAAGVPAVGTRVGGIPEVIEDGITGWLVESGDAQGLAGAILRLLGDEDRRRSMGISARRRAVSLFSWEQIVQDLLSLYHSVSRTHEELFLESPGTPALSPGAQPTGRQVR